MSKNYKITIDKLRSFLAFLKFALSNTLTANYFLSVFRVHNTTFANVPYPITFSNV